MPSVLPTLYDVLGIKPRAPMEDVRKAYRQLAREYHPDLNPDPASHEKMAQINAAFEVLADPVRRSEYDLSVGNVSYGEATTARTKKSEAVVTNLLHRHREHKTPIYGVAFLEDGRLVSVSFDNELVWWDKESNRAQRKLHLEGGAISTIRALKDETIVAAGGTEQSLGCWRIQKGEPSSWRQSPKQWFNSFSLSPNGELLAMGSTDTVVRVIKAVNGRSAFSGIGHKDAVTAVAWSSDSQTLASGSADASVILWDPVSGKKKGEIHEIRSQVTAIAFSDDNRRIAVAAVDLSVRVFDLHTNRLVKKFFGHTKPVEALAFHPKGWLLASAGRDGTIGLWSIKTGIGHCFIEASHQAVSCVAFNKEGDRLAAGGLDKTLRIWSVGKSH